VGAVSVVYEICARSSRFAAQARDPDDQPFVPRQSVQISRLFDTDLGEVVGFEVGLVVFNPVTGEFSAEGFEEFAAYSDALARFSYYLEIFTGGYVL